MILLTKPSFFAVVVVVINVFVFAFVSLLGFSDVCVVAEPSAVAVGLVDALYLNTGILAISSFVPPTMTLVTLILNVLNATKTQGKQNITAAQASNGISKIKYPSRIQVRMV